LADAKASAFFIAGGMVKGMLRRAEAILRITKDMSSEDDKKGRLSMGQGL
jgi:hypothetical protein